MEIHDLCVRNLRETIEAIQDAKGPLGSGYEIAAFAIATVGWQDQQDEMESWFLGNGKEVLQSHIQRAQHACGSLLGITDAASEILFDPEPENPLQGRENFLKVLRALEARLVEKDSALDEQDVQKVFEEVLHCKTQTEETQRCASRVLDHQHDSSRGDAPQDGESTARAVLTATGSPEDQALAESGDAKQVRRRASEMLGLTPEAGELLFANSPEGIQNDYEANFVIAGVMGLARAGWPLLGIREARRTLDDLQRWGREA